jgi:hypothetical protein
MKECVFICFVMYGLSMTTHCINLSKRAFIFYFFRKSYTMHHIKRQRAVHDCLDKKLAIPPHLLDLEKCVTPKGQISVSSIPFIICHLYRYTVVIIIVMVIILVFLVQCTVLEMLYTFVLVLLTCTTAWTVHSCALTARARCSIFKVRNRHRSGFASSGKLAGYEMVGLPTLLALARRPLEKLHQ